MQQFSMNPDPASWVEVEGEQIAFDPYPDGSFSFRINNLREHVGAYTVTLKSTLPQAILAAGQVINALRTTSPTALNISLHVQTLPDQRGDKVTMPGAGMPMQVTARFLAACEADIIVVYDVHSKEALNMLQSACFNTRTKVTHVESLACFLRAGGGAVVSGPASFFVAVDKGAISRAEAAAKAFSGYVIYAGKKRNEKGEIVGHQIVNIEHDWIPGSEIWVLDDMCDGGKTFESISDILAATYHNVSKFHLFVTHGVFSKGRGELLARYDTVEALFSYDDWRTHPTDRGTGVYENRGDLSINEGSKALKA